MTWEQPGTQAVLESSPVPHPERTPWHAEDCVVDIRDLEHYIKSSKAGETMAEWKPESKSLCGAVGSLASMPFRFLSKSRSTTDDKRCNSSDGCSNATEEAICAFTPFQPENSSDFLRSENSSDSHDANSYHNLPHDPREELDRSLSALSISQSLTNQAHSDPPHAPPGAMATPQRSWVGAFKNVVSGGRPIDSQLDAGSKFARSAGGNFVQLCSGESSFQSYDFDTGMPVNNATPFSTSTLRVD